MATIFKWFFGIVGTILIVYILVLFLRSIPTWVKTVSGTTTTTTTIATSSEQNVGSVTDSIKNFFKNVYKGSAYTAGSVVVSGEHGSGNVSGYRNPIADKILNAYSHWDFYATSTDDFDTRWGSKNKYLDDSTQSNYTQTTGSQTQTSGKVLDSNYTSQKQTSERILITTNLNSTVRNNQIIAGYADSNVFTERTFPIYILGPNKEVIGEVKAFTNGDKRSNGYIPFRGVLSFSAPKETYGYLMFLDESNLYKVSFVQTSRVNILNHLPKIIQPSNYFKNFSTYTKNERCVRAGCSQQFCIDESLAPQLVSSCEYLNAYSCYRTAICERDYSTGKCGWRMDTQLAQCLEYTR